MSLGQHAQRPALAGVIRSSLMVLFAFGLWGMIGLQALPAAAAGSSALTIAPAHGLAGSAITISGIGYGPTETVTLYWNCKVSPCTASPVLGTATTNTSGAFTGLAATVPAATPGKYDIAGLGATSADFAVKSFTVTAPKGAQATLTVTPTHGAPGTAATVSGVSFAASETVTFYWNCATSACASTTVLGSTTSSTTGAFSAVAITIPTTATAGKFDIGAKGATGDFAVKSYTVSLKPTLTATPTHVTSAGQLTLTGTGFGPNELVTFYWNCATKTCVGATVIGSVTTNASGAFSGVVVTIPTATVGATYAVGAKGGTTGAFVATDVKVVA